MNTFKSFAQMLEALPTDKACREYLEQIRWNGEPRCPQCGFADSNHYKLKVKGEFKGLYKCRNCNERFTVSVGTMFEGSHIGYRKWFIAIYIFQSHKKGISSHQLARDIGITQKSAWFMLQRIRATLVDTDDKLLSGIVEVDETYIGGKERNKCKRIRRRNKEIAAIHTKRTAHIHPFDEKIPVLGILQRDGNVRVFPISAATRPVLIPILAKHINPKAEVVTDGLKAYNVLGETYSLHVSVNHKQDEWAKGIYNTNSIEGFWSHLKRGIFGIYHQVSPKHLQCYCDEFAFRYNERKTKEGDRFNISLRRTEGVRLTYNTLITRATQ